MLKVLGCEDNKRIWNEKFSFNDSQDSKPLVMIDGMSELDYEIKRLKVQHIYQREQEKMLDKQSDLFEERFGDTFDSMGDDITQEEFLQRETDWRDE